MTEPRYGRFLPAGAADRLGAELRRALDPVARKLRLASRDGISDLAAKLVDLGHADDAPEN